MPRLIRPAGVMEMTSLSVRQIQTMAAAGQIPSAAKLGGVWTFDPQAIEAWIEERRAYASRPRPPRISAVAKTRDKVLSFYEAEKIQRRFEQLMQGNLKSDSKRRGRK
jgi:predicted DNA-binding transcriptional regulator AlpA